MELSVRIKLKINPWAGGGKGGEGADGGAGER